MTGSLAVMAVLMAETAVGGTVVTLTSGVYGNVRRGFLLLSGAILTASAWAAWAAARAAVGGTASPAQARMVLALGVFTVALVVWQVLEIARVALARWVGLAAAAVGVGALGSIAVARDGNALLAAIELAAGAFFLGSALYGLLLGHWYLVERRLSSSYMERSAALYAAGVLAAIVGAVLATRHPTPAATGFSPFLAVPGFSVLLVVGLVAICALIAGFVWKLAQEGGRSIQAATGMFYLAVIMAFSAELSSKVGFFG